MAKPLRLRTVLTALVVVGASSVTGMGIGQLATKIALGSDKPKAARPKPNRKTAIAGNTARVRVTPGGFMVNDAPGASPFQIIYPNPRDLFPDRVITEPGSGGIGIAAAASPSLPLWRFNVTASADRGGANYTGLIVGADPFNRRKTTTTIPVVIVPLVITISDYLGRGTVTFDPSVNDPCASNISAVNAVTGSPIFTNNTWTMNGINVGNTQYSDAFQRAQFWSVVAGTNYHLILQPTTVASQSLSFSGTGATGGQIFTGTTACGTDQKLGIVNVNALDAAVQAIINGPLAAAINAGKFPIFLTRNVVSANNYQNLNTCCILGYHGAFNDVSGNLQIYSPFSVDTAQFFGPGLVSTLSHEILEAINDPTGNTPTPPWGGIGQVNGCQGNFETGDPLSPGGILPTSNQFVVTGGNGLTYQLQENAFLNWFYGNASLGVGGLYSNNGTLKGDAKPCPPGGTN